MNWGVENFRPYEKGTLRGFFDLRISDIIIHGFSLHRKNGERWVSMPSREYMDNGEKKYAPNVEFTSKERRWDFQRWALKELDKILPAKVLPEKPQPVGAGEDHPF